MIAARLAAACAAAALFGASPPAVGQAVIDTVFLIKNNTSAQLRCRYRLPGGAWSATFRFRPGAEFERRELGEEKLHFLCGRPARRVVFVVRAGERNAMLRAADGTVAMRRIDVPGDDG